ncbi:hypothetical protein, partial [Streptomyces himastatinicus]|uniref:hypothetical protein n=1 Tax=Streptomyces himastatinicus TaxID=998084 RepID=UPI001AD8266E
MEDAAEAQFMGDAMGEGGLAGAGLAGDQERAAQMDGGVDHPGLFRARRGRWWRRPVRAGALPR